MTEKVTLPFAIHSRFNILLGISFAEFVQAKEFVIAVWLDAEELSALLNRISETSHTVVKVLDSKFPSCHRVDVGTYLITHRRDAFLFGVNLSDVLVFILARVLNDR